MKIAINIIRIILTAVLLIIIALNGWLLIDREVMGNDPPTVLGYSYFAVLSGSMEPEISVGDIVITKGKASYNLGEVVSFKDMGGSVVTHRIIGRTSDGFITKGDANNVEDNDLLAPNNIIGEVVLCVAGAGSVIMFLTSPLGMLVLIAVGFLIIGLPSLLGGGGNHKKGRHHVR